MIYEVAQRRWTITRLDGIVTGRLKCRAEHQANTWLVVDNQDRRGGVHGLPLFELPHSGMSEMQPTQNPCQTHVRDPRHASLEGYVDIAGRSDASEVPARRAYCKGRWAACTTGKRAALQFKFISGREIQTFNFGRGCGFEPARPGGPARTVGID